MTAQAAKTKKVFDNRYEIVSIVGRGGRSVVYHARLLMPPYSSVALKVLLDDKDKNSCGERLRREALAMVSSRHRYVVRLDDFHSVGPLCYLSMEFAPESDLRVYTKKLGGKLPSLQAEKFLLQATEALAFVHKAGIIHRDLKPDNILVMSDREIRLADFGVSILPGEATSAKELQSGVGTMNYMAPEILEGKAFDKRSDVYALGVSFYEMLTGKNPFESSSLAEQQNARKDQNIPKLSSLLPNLPTYIASVITQALSYYPEKRFTSAKDFAQALMLGRANSSKARNSKYYPLDKKGPTANSGVDRNLRPTSPNQTSSSPPEKSSPQNSTSSLPEKAKDPLAPKPEASKKPEPVQFSKPAQEGVKEENPVTSTVVINPKSSPSLTTTPFSDITPELAKTPADATIEVPFPLSQKVGQEPKRQEEKTPNDKLITQKTTTIERKTVEKIRSAQVNKELVDQIRTSAQSKTQHKNTTPPSASSPLDQPVVSKLSIPSPPTPTPKTTGISLLRNRKQTFTRVIIAAVVLTILLPLVARVFSPTTQVATKPVTIIPPVSNKDFTFPLLPSGLYAGAINGLLPNKTFPLAMVSIEEQDALAIAVGLEGWKPAVLHPRTLLASEQHQGSSRPLRVASNGFIIELTGQNVDGELFGFFTNIVTGEQGEWRVQPVH